jgi:hypothetical protein
MIVVVVVDVVEEKEVGGGVVGVCGKRDSREI